MWGRTKKNNLAGIVQQLSKAKCTILVQAKILFYNVQITIQTFQIVTFLDLFLDTNEWFIIYLCLVCDFYSEIQIYLNQHLF